MFIWGHSQREGWFYTNQWHYYQQRRGNVSSYVERMMGFYRVHVTYSGRLDMCDIEIRKEDLSEAFKIAEEYLEKYRNVESKSILQQDYYSPHHPNGWWKLYMDFKDSGEPWRGYDYIDGRQSE